MTVKQTGTVECHSVSTERESVTSDRIVQISLMSLVSVEIATSNMEFAGRSSHLIFFNFPTPFFILFSILTLGFRTDFNTIFLFPDGRMKPMMIRMILIGPDTLDLPTQSELVHLLITHTATVQVGMK